MSDIKYALRRLNEMIAKRPIKKKFTAWHEQIAEWKESAPLRYAVTEEVLQSRAHAGSSERQGERSHPAADGDRDALRADQGRSDHHHRRGPAPDVGGAVLQIQIPAPVAHQRRPGRDGLRLSRGARREGGLSRTSR